jgi:dihydropteroate synthase
MGVLNVTPDSFSDGGRYAAPAAATERAFAMIRQGAAIVDMGAESSRPGSSSVPPREQLRRLLPVLKAFRRKSKAPVSIDTTSSLVAQACLDEGASMINDISALRFDEKMVDVVRKSDCRLVLMHMRGTPKTMQRRPAYKDVVRSIIEFLRERIRFCEESGIVRSRLIVDPGVGFGKTLEHNLTILRRLDELQRLKTPVLIGASRKAFLGKLSGEKIPEQRVIESVTVAMSAVLKGATIVRAHDVAEHVAALKVLTQLAPELRP